MVSTWLAYVRWIGFSEPYLSRVISRYANRRSHSIACFAGSKLLTRQCCGILSHQMKYSLIVLLLVFALTGELAQTAVAQPLPAPRLMSTSRIRCP